MQENLVTNEGHIKKIFVVTYCIHTRNVHQNVYICHSNVGIDLSTTNNPFVTNSGSSKPPQSYQWHFIMHSIV